MKGKPAKLTSTPRVSRPGNSLVRGRALASSSRGSNTGHHRCTVTVTNPRQLCANGISIMHVAHAACLPISGFGRGASIFSLSRPFRPLLSTDQLGFTYIRYTRGDFQTVVAWLPVVACLSPSVRILGPARMNVATSVAPQVALRAFPCLATVV